jgi:stage V sporulation protein G
MEITEVRVRLVNGGAERLRAFCSVTLDGDFVIRDLKVIDGTNGHFVAMPSRKLAYRCGRCGSKNHLRAKFCNECGAKLSERRMPRDPNGRTKLHVDVAHPINTACRERIQKAVIESFLAECEKAKLPDYQPTAAEDDEDFETSEYSDLVAELKEAAARRHEERSGAREPGLAEEPPAAPPPPRQEPRRREEPPPPRRADRPAASEPPREAAPRRQEPPHRPAPPPAPARPAPPPPPPPPRDEPAGDDFAAGLI